MQLSQNAAVLTQAVYLDALMVYYCDIYIVICTFLMLFDCSFT